MALWPYTPQTTLTETFEGRPLVNAVSPGVRFAGAPTGGLAVRRTFVLGFQDVSSAQAHGMATFYREHRAGLDAFDFLNPNDGRIYRVVFAVGPYEMSAASPQTFTPERLRFEVIA